MVPAIVSSFFRDTALGYRGAALAFVLLWTAHAHANGRPSSIRDEAPDALPVTLEAEVGGSTNAGGWGLTGVLAGRVAAARQVELTLELPVVVTEPPGVDSAHDGFFSGNPYFAIHYVDRDRDGEGYFRIGAGFTAPLSGLDDAYSLGDARGSGLVMAMNGGADEWLFEADSTALVLPIRSEGRHGIAVLGADLVFAVPLQSNVGLITIQLFPSVGAQLDDLLLGARLQLVWMPIVGEAFVALAPFAQVELSDSSFLFTRFVLNVDEPLGLVGNGAGVWGVFLGGGVRF